ncbi:MurR/RpiR family transcriptional regulator [Niallia sp. Krafla_26]|uniref:MurR/RpiR family transcriptional regulator n=1 Tax=Niallia sp. Krafla_26 TaxID=3064703 RepID=UPI003D17B8D7
MHRIQELWFHYTLNLLRKNVTVYREYSDRLFFLTDELNANSTVFIITFHRYRASSLRVAKEAKKRGAQVLAITDSVLSPIASHADTLVSLGLGQQSTIDVSVP